MATPPADKRLLAYLRSMDLQRFERDAASFSARDLAGTDVPTLRNLYYELIAPMGNATLPHNISSYPAGTVFWRVRPANKSESAHTPTIRDQADLWAPPAQYVKARGRLNDVGEPLLYVCAADPFLAIAEGRIAELEDFYLIRYVAQRPMQVCMIPGPPPEQLRLPKSIRAKYEALWEFHRTEFTRQAEVDGPGAYVFSEFVAKDMFDLPPDVQDGWCYPSVLAPPRVNVAMRPTKALEVLRCTGVAKCRWSSGDAGQQLELFIASNADTGGGQFDWRVWPNNVAKAAFPEFA